jgi:hypothetical protein
MLSMSRLALRLISMGVALASAACATGAGTASPPVAAQDATTPARPDFSGTWLLDERASQALAGGGAGGGAGTGQGGGLGLGPPPERITISQNASEMIVEETFGSTRTRLRYRLDGNLVRNNVAVGGGRARGSGGFRSSWDGDRLVTSFTVQVMNVPAREYREVRSLTPEGTLIVEISAVGRVTAGRRTEYQRAG